jgi:cytochrome c
MIELRLDSPTGELIGQTQVSLPEPSAAPFPRSRSGPPMLTMSLKPVAGMHDLYLVFKNERARQFQPLMSVMTIQLRQ